MTGLISPRVSLFFQLMQVAAKPVCKSDYASAMV